MKVELPPVPLLPLPQQPEETLSGGKVGELRRTCRWSADLLAARSGSTRTQWWRGPRSIEPGVASAAAAMSEAASASRDRPLWSPPAANCPGGDTYPFDAWPELGVWRLVAGGEEPVQGVTNPPEYWPPAAERCTSAGEVGPTPERPVLRGGVLPMASNPAAASASGDAGKEGSKAAAGSTGVCRPLFPAGQTGVLGAGKVPATGSLMQGRVRE
jgi:hypothetical protein